MSTQPSSDSGSHSQNICPLAALRRRIRELEGGIKKHLKKVVHSDGGYWECDEELKKLVGE